MPFGLTKAAATFHSYINNCLRRFIDDFVVCFLNDILIYSTNEEEHEEQVWKVLECLRGFGLYAKAEQCHFGVIEVGFVWFVISPDTIGIELDSISMPEDWPTPECVWDVQVLLGFTHFYRWFIRKYAKVTTLISNLLKKIGTSRTPKQLKWEWTWDAELAFRKLKRAFTNCKPFWPGKADDSTDGCKRLCHSRHGQPVWQFLNSETGRLLLSKMHRCETQLWHIWSEALGHHGDYKAMVPLPWGSES